MPSDYAFEDLKSILADPSVDWSEPAYSIKKAYVMSLFAALAYEYLFDFEINDLERIKVVPSFWFQQRAQQGQTFNTASLRSRLGLEAVDFHQGEFAHYFIFWFRDVVVVAIRGTAARMADVLADVKIFKQRESLAGSTKGSFHRGFFSEVVKNISALNKKIEKYGVFEKPHANGVKLYITGHSLGGAVGAILHGLWSRNCKPELIEWSRICSGLANQDEYLSHSSYVFGAPRICDSQTLAFFRKSFCCCNEADLVPRMPPERFGYCDLPVTQSLEPVDPEISNGTVFQIWLSYFPWYPEISNHYIDTYRQCVGELIGIKSPSKLIPDEVVEKIAKKPKSTNSTTHPPSAPQ
jgi:hypothetical protein